MKSSYYKPAITWTHYIRGFTQETPFCIQRGIRLWQRIRGIELPFYERYFLGGERSIRGYEIRIVAPIADES